MTAVLPDVDLDVDWDRQIVCNIGWRGRPDCSDPARWRSIVRHQDNSPCDAAHFACQACRVGVDRDMARITTTLVCARHLMPGKNTWEPL